MDDELNIKYENLKNYLRKTKKAAVAFSFGVDSTFLLDVCFEVLKNNVLAIIVLSNSFPDRESKGAIDFCKKKNINYEIIKFNEFEIEGYKNNPINRCYLCKKEMFKKIKSKAFEYGIKNILEGSNTDDMKDYRPGLKALLELEILSPLKEAKLNKEEIRILSKERNLKTFNKPSFACLATRISYGDEITKEKLKMIEEAEQILYNLGFYQFRVRLKEKDARIEILEDEFEKLIENKTRKKIMEEFKKIGFEYISLDLEGYRQGSQNLKIKGNFTP